MDKNFKATYIHIDTHNLGLMAIILSVNVQLKDKTSFLICTHANITCIKFT